MKQEEEGVSEYCVSFHCVLTFIVGYVICLPAVA
jgi:hypothetical protein